MLIISVVPYVLLNAVPELSQNGHLAILLAATIGVTLPVAIALHRHVEVPGIAFGRKLAGGRSEGRIAKGRMADAGDTPFRLDRTPDSPISWWRLRE